MAYSLDSGAGNPGCTCELCSGAHLLPFFAVCSFVLQASCKQLGGQPGLVPGHQAPSQPGMARQRAKRRAGHSANVSDLPDQVLLLVFRQAGLARLAAAQTCKHWCNLSQDAAFCHKVLRGGCIATALSTAGPGDTVELACGMYEVSLAQSAGTEHHLTLPQAASSRG